MSRLQEKIRDGQFVITAEIVPPLAASPDALLKEAATFGASVDAINVTDAAAGRIIKSGWIERGTTAYTTRTVTDGSLVNVAL